MNITAIRSDELYRNMMASSDSERVEIYRYQLMKPFEQKWQCIGMPLKSDSEGGYDVVSASTMGGGYHPTQITEARKAEIAQISDNSFWDSCESSIRNTLESFEQHGILLPIQSYVFTILLNDPHNPMSALTGDYCGDGGIPGYIIGTIIPNERSLRMLPVALAHEANHNVRWQFIKWTPAVTLADMIVSEGIAETYAALMFGEDQIGPWIKNTTPETLASIIKPALHANLYDNDFMKISSYLYGDEIMALRGANAIGMPYCAGYACGYALIQHYLKKTNKNIYETTITPTAEILQETEDFWR